jgi:hypothetical protein
VLAIDVSEPVCYQDCFHKTTQLEHHRQRVQMLSSISAPIGNLIM